MAFQPIIDVRSNSIFAFEALVRGSAGESAATILSSVNQQNRYAFDQECRVAAIQVASRLNLPQTGASLSINFLPNAVYEPRACIRQTLTTAMATSFPLDQIIFEFTETEAIDTAHLLNILRAYRAMGFRTAIDDFGAGHSGLALLTKFQPDIVKLDMELIRGIDRKRVSQSVVRHTLSLLNDLDVQAVCEGVETEGEFETLRELGVHLMQGYLFASPEFERLPLPIIPGTERASVAA